MFSPLRNRFGIPGVISVIALVFAMLGGAYAANNSGGGKATASAKGKPGPRGPRGKTGSAGPAGPQGPAGANGAKGDAGAKGDTGNAGAPGKDGTSATTASFLGSKGTCNEGQGGVEVKSASPAAFVCNGLEGAEGEPGEPGEPGEDGEPWAPNNTLPANATETGTWIVSGGAPGSIVYTVIPFAVQIPKLIKAEHIHYGAEGDAEFHAVCPGTITEPTAPPGELCVYFNQVETQNMNFKEVVRPSGLESKGATKPGAFLKFEVGAGTPATAVGSWAVTGCNREGEPPLCF